MALLLGAIAFHLFNEGIMDNYLTLFVDGDAILVVGCGGEWVGDESDDRAKRLCFIEENPEIVFDILYSDPCIAAVLEKGQRFTITLLNVEFCVADGYLDPEHGYMEPEAWIETDGYKFE